MKTTIKAILYVFFTLSLLSCVLLPRRKLQIFTSFKEMQIDGWKIGSIQIEDRSVYDLPEAQIAGILQTLAEKRGIRISQEHSNNTDDNFGSIDLWIREKEFIRNLDTVNSITVILTFRDPRNSGEILKAIYIEESHETVESTYHLYSILERLIKVASKELQK